MCRVCFFFFKQRPACEVRFRAGSSDGCSSDWQARVGGGGVVEYYDDLETRDPEAREAALLAALPVQVAHAKAKAPAYAEILAGVDPAAVTDRGALAQLPVIRKADLMERQSPAAPFGGLATLPVTAAARLFASPGPIYEFETARPGFWRLDRAWFAAGFRAGDIVHNCFAYHLTPGGWMLDGAARGLGCTVIAGGTDRKSTRLNSSH